MQNLKKNLFNPSFSHIYVERQVLDHYRTGEIIKKFPNSQIIKIDHYKDVFSRTRQNFSIQKNSMNLIIAEKKGKLIYKGARVCHDFGHENFYYTSTIMNCIYDCEYCYLQGMYPSANVVIFVNIEDVFREIETLLSSQSVYLCISYDTDLLAMENITGYVKQWVDFSRNQPDLTIELRTKSSNFGAMECMEPSNNVILAWTLSPQDIISNYESKAPSLMSRIYNIKAAMKKGWKIRLCFDPVLYINQWEEAYARFIEKVFEELPGERIFDVSLGLFRVSKDYLKTMVKNRPESLLLNYPFHNENDVCSYDAKLSQKMILALYGMLKVHIAEDKIFVL